jgi:hypothetical protein
MQRFAQNVAKRCMTLHDPRWLAENAGFGCKGCNVGRIDVASEAGWRCLNLHMPRDHPV